MSEFEQRANELPGDDFKSLNSGEVNKDLEDLIGQSLEEVKQKQNDFEFEKLLKTNEDETKAEVLSDMLVDISQSVDASLSKLKVVAAEADSSTGDLKNEEEEKREEKKEEKSEQKKEEKKEDKKEQKKEQDSKKPVSVLCHDGECPYYKMGMKLVNSIEIPQKVQDLLLWKNAKLTGAVFSTLFVLLVSVASLSLLTVISSLMLLALVGSGSYRFYLAVMFRIKGIEDNTFEKLSEMDISVQKDKIERVTSLLENEVNTVLKQAKSILLWDNITKSAIALFAFYVVYCIGSIFNIVTICLMILVSSFTIPKFYQVYKVQIDSGLEAFSNKVHQLVKQVVVKVPMLQKIPMFSKKKLQ